ncbi:MAG: AbrB/MazE/SpoVT family DNA-binding domain-containing protein [Gemmataceae bacterium]
MEQVYHTIVGRGGRLVIPAPVRDALHLTPGEKAIVTVVDDELRIRSLDATIRDIQEHCRQYVIPGVSIVDELIAERRAEAAREDAVLANFIAKKIDA